MIEVSQAFLDAMKVRRDFRCRIHVTFSNGTETDLMEDSFSVSGNGIISGNNVDGLPIGEAVGRSIFLELVTRDIVSSYSWVGAKIQLYLSFPVGDQVELIDMGTFTVTEPETVGYTISITAHDDMYLTDKPYDSELEYPNTLTNIFADACLRCGIPYESKTFFNSDFEVLARPNNVTYRQILGMVAMLAGGNVIINRSGNAEIKTYSFSLSGNYPTLDGWFDISNEQRHFTITGLSTTVTDYIDGRVVASTLLEGEDGYVLPLQNPMMDGKESEALKRLSSVFIGKSVWRFSGEHASDPRIEFMDRVFVVSKNNMFVSTVTDINFVFLGSSSFANSAATEAKVNSTYKVQENVGKKTDEMYEELMASIRRTETGLSFQVAKLNDLASVTMTKDQIELTITRAIEAIDGVDTKTGVVVDAEGLKVYREGDAVENRITHGGMYVRRNAGEEKEDVLVADEDGVNALNLTARKYLIIGETSRFEDYVDEDGKKRTACFWIGG